MSETSATETARILSEALPFLQRYDDQVVVVKYGGHAMVDPELSRKFARDMVMLKLCGIHPVVVHGGGPQINRLLDKLQVKSEFREGLRVTDKETMEVVEMVLAGSINKSIVGLIQSAGGRAVGISGKDGNLLMTERFTKTKVNAETGQTETIDFGYVGEPHRVNTEILQTIIHSDAIPVIAPVGVGMDGESYNVNADTAAGAIAMALHAKRLLLLTDVAGVLDKNKELIHELTLAGIPKLIAEGTITGGMIPKIESCVSVVESGVEGVIILDGRVPHSVLLELFTPHGVGTRVSRSGV
ncbi:acetylglutamate kinase [Aestuariivirga sp. YIM B02566]|uniref:Acetylglutamate kinase n=1 Tax=Taklimakanibacter albus TaxID=2800327 RepID=A0ACC5RC10_9HYPH|nr:acetylglutamate kinase [Aestuariivirga sp. YIM B02566]MBK1870152.1 acetylglutamate kinase [Aestuariivirga sp. YIM B02566]